MYLALIKANTDQEWLNPSLYLIKSLLSPLHTLFVHLIYNDNHLCYAETFSEIYVLSGLPTKIESSLELTFSRRYDQTSIVAQLRALDH